MSAHLKYLRYVARHKWFVFRAGLLTKASLWRLVKHDWSKFLPCEWVPYALYFYGDLPKWDQAKIACPGYNYRNTKEGMAECFDTAWLHHQHANDHHWQHWVLREDSGATKVLDMPVPVMREMVADWMGAGRAITGKWEALTWYTKNRDQIMLSENTRWRVEALLNKLAQEGWA